MKLRSINLESHQLRDNVILSKFRSWELFQKKPFSFGHLKTDFLTEYLWMLKTLYPIDEYLIEIQKLS